MATHSGLAYASFLLVYVLDLCFVTNCYTSENPTINSFTSKKVQHSDMPSFTFQNVIDYASIKTLLC